MSEGGTHGMTKRLKEYTRPKRLGTTEPETSEHAQC